MSVLDKIKSNSTIKESAILSKSKFFHKKDMIQTSIPAINLALSGEFDGGLTPGLTIWAGPSKHFKSLFSLLLTKAYMEKYPDAAVLFYDSEFGTPESYFNSFGIDPDRVLHSPLTDIEVFKFDIMNQLKNIDRGDKLIIIVDSLGNLASKKEVRDAIDEKETTDMTRAKQIKSLFRMVNPHLNLKDIPMIVVNHTYKTLEKYAKEIVGGGTGPYYSADNIFILGRQQEKDNDDELVGYNYIINVEKSRYVIEKSKIPISVTFDGGISRWSGLLDIALESGHVIKTKIGNANAFSKINRETGEVDEKKYKTKETNTKDFWLPVLMDKTFREFATKKYKLATNAILQDGSEDLFEESKPKKGEVK